MKKTRVILVGGFLGAGKTTALLELARRQTEGGRRVGIVTNDQSFDLVDTARARVEGVAVEEVGGGCFCCRFDSLVEAIEELRGGAAIDLLLAEPVGSCTDLAATVTWPLRELRGDELEVAPLSVMVDPRRAAGILGLRPGKRFSDKVAYVYRKQLEEAEIIAVNKVETQAPAERERLLAALGAEYPEAELRAVSCRSGEGLGEWFARLEETDSGERGLLSIDYDLYAEGEARLGWVNLRASVESATELDGDELLLRLARDLRDRLAAGGARIAHLKAILQPSDGPDLAAVGLTSEEEEPQPTHRLAAPLASGELVINLRAEHDPAELEAWAREALAALVPLRASIERAASFRPGRPEPTHRRPGEGPPS